jgi:hypothetical protein
MQEVKPKTDKYGHTEITLEKAYELIGDSLKLYVGDLIYDKEGSSYRIVEEK